MGNRRWQILPILLLAACQDDPSSVETVNVEAATTAEDVAADANLAAGNEQAVAPTTPPPKPVIDLQVVSLELPQIIKRETEFPITVTVHNNSDTDLSFAELNVRAVVRSPTNVMDLALGSNSARDIGANQSKSVTFNVRAPHVVAAPAEFRVKAKPVLATDPRPENNVQRRDAYVTN